VLVSFQRQATSHEPQVTCQIEFANWAPLFAILVRRFRVDEHVRTEALLVKEISARQLLDVALFVVDEDLKTDRTRDLLSQLFRFLFHMVHNVRVIALLLHLYQ
jgi:hypothetical protein